MTVSYSINGQEKTAKEIQNIELVHDTIIAICNAVRDRVMKGDTVSSS